jgi:hypothetical protein
VQTKQPKEKARKKKTQKTALFLPSCQAKE